MPSRKYPSNPRPSRSSTGKISACVMSSAGQPQYLRQRAILIAQEFRLLHRHVEGKDQHLIAGALGDFDHITHRAQDASARRALRRLRASRSIAAMRTATPISTCS